MCLSEAKHSLDWLRGGAVIRYLQRSGVATLSGESEHFVTETRAGWSWRPSCSEQQPLRRSQSANIHFFHHMF
jgi:hypothetical protein